MAVSKTSVGITIASGETTGSSSISQVTGELLAIVFVLPSGAPPGALYHIYQTSPTVTLLGEVTGQQIADADGVFIPRKLANAPDGTVLGFGGAPYPALIPLAARITMEISAAVAGTYTAHIYFQQ